MKHTGPRAWPRPYLLERPTIWFHDLFYPDGRPYPPREVDLMRSLTSGK